MYQSYVMPSYVTKLLRKFNSSTQKDFETFMQDIYKIDLFVFAQNVLVWFLVVVVGYALVSYVIYSVKYSRAKKNQKIYYNNLKKLSSMYDERE